MAIVDRVGASVLSSLEFVGALATFGGRAIVDAFRPPYEVGEIVRHLYHITFEIPTAKAFVLPGRSGTGKSVMLRHIIGLVQPDEGHVFVGGRDRKRSAIANGSLPRIVEFSDAGVRTWKP